jgi:flagellar basal body-associated protein FliL
MSTAESQPSLILPIAAFLAVAGSFGVGLAISLHHAAPEPLVAEPEAIPPEEMMKVYYPFPEDIFITRADQTMVIAAVSFYLEGSPAALLHLQEVAKARQAELQAALLESAQLQSEASADIPAYRADLPAALLGRVNALLGDETMPAPVKEVLLTKFVAR